MTHTPLDSFESALLAELRTHVAERPAQQVGPRATRGRRVRRLAVGAVAAGLAASVVGVVSLGGHGGASPAYAVELDGDGDVVVTVHRLDDAAGLEAALRDNGIDADVSYDPDGTTTFGIGPGGSLDSGEVSEDKLHEVPEGGSVVVGVPEPGEQYPADDACGLDADPASLDRQGDNWVLRIPAGSPLMDRHVEIGTDASGGLTVFYAGDEPGTACGVMQAQAHLR